MAQMVPSQSIILSSVGLSGNWVPICSFNVMDAEKALFSLTNVSYQLVFLSILLGFETATL